MEGTAGIFRGGRCEGRDVTGVLADRFFQMNMFVLGARAPVSEKIARPQQIPVRTN